MKRPSAGALPEDGRVEVDQACASIGANHHIGRLDVSMNDAVRVQVRDSLSEVDGQGHDGGRSRRVPGVPMAFAKT